MFLVRQHCRLCFAFYGTHQVQNNVKNVIPSALVNRQRSKLAVKSAEHHRLSLSMSAATHIGHCLPSGEAVLPYICSSDRPVISPRRQGGFRMTKPSAPGSRAVDGQPAVVAGRAGRAEQHVRAGHGDAAAVRPRPAAASYMVAGTAAIRIPSPACCWPAQRIED